MCAHTCGCTCLHAGTLSEIYQLIRTTDVTNNLNHILHNPLPSSTQIFGFNAIPYTNACSKHFHAVHSADSINAKVYIL